MSFFADLKILRQWESNTRTDNKNDATSVSAYSKEIRLWMFMLRNNVPRLREYFRLTVTYIIKIAASHTKDLLKHRVMTNRQRLLKHS